MKKHTSGSKKRELDEVAATEEKLHHHAAPILDASALSGAIAGAVMGSVAGPPGIVAGGIVGTAMGIVAGVALDNADRVHDSRDKELDDDIGVTKGDLGAAGPNAPKARRGAYSAASAGAGGPSGTTAEGPMQDVDEG
jgi:hypothetical protein